MKEMPWEFWAIFGFGFILFTALAVGGEAYNIVAPLTDDQWKSAESWVLFRRAFLGSMGWVSKRVLASGLIALFIKYLVEEVINKRDEREHALQTKLGRRNLAIAAFERSASHVLALIDWREDAGNRQQMSWLFSSNSMAELSQYAQLLKSDKNHIISVLSEYRGACYDLLTTFNYKWSNIPHFEQEEAPILDLALGNVEFDCWIGQMFYLDWILNKEIEGFGNESDFLKEEFSIKDELFENAQHAFSRYINKHGGDRNVNSFQEAKNEIGSCKEIRRILASYFSYNVRRSFQSLLSQP